MRHGEENVPWSERVKWYTKSSGTTNDRGKFIPASNGGLNRTHYQGGKDTVTLYLRNNPGGRMFGEKGLISNGSHSPNYNLRNSLVSDLSTILIRDISPLVNLMRVPKKSAVLLRDFEVRRDYIARGILNQNITDPLDVPS